MGEVLGTWVAAFLTLGIFSWMYKENAWFRVAEQVYVGASLGYLAITGFQNLKEVALVPATQGKHIMWVPLFMGFLLFSRWSPKYSWISRSSMGFLVGTTAAVTLAGAVKAQLLEQVVATMLPLTSINNVIFVFFTITSTMYFLFTLQNKKALPAVDIGKYALMIAFGATFGNTVMSRISLFTGRMQFLLFEWLKIGG